MDRIPQRLPQKIPSSKPIRIPKKKNTELQEEFCEDRDFPNNNNPNFNKPNPNNPFKAENLFDKLHQLEIHVGSFQRYQMPLYIEKMHSGSPL